MDGGSVLGMRVVGRGSFYDKFKPASEGGFLEDFAAHRIFKRRFGGGPFL